MISYTFFGGGMPRATVLSPWAAPGTWSLFNIGTGRFPSLKVTPLGSDLVLRCQGGYQFMGGTLVPMWQLAHFVDWTSLYTFQDLAPIIVVQILFRRAIAFCEHIASHSTSYHWAFKTILEGCSRFMQWTHTRIKSWLHPRWSKLQNFEQLCWVPLLPPRLLAGGLAYKSPHT